MKVILKQDVVNLGEEGDVCEVARGYARNYLVPQGFAMLYNRANLTEIESRRTAIEQRKAEKQKAALEIGERLSQEELVFRMNAGENGKLFGAVTSAMIADELAKRNVLVERRKVDVPDGTIKAVGKYNVGVKLYGDSEVQLTVRVVAANAPAEEAAESGAEQAARTATPAEEAAAAGETSGDGTAGSGAPDETESSPEPDEEKERS